MILRGIPGITNMLIVTQHRPAPTNGRKTRRRRPRPRPSLSFCQVSLCCHRFAILSFIWWDRLGVIDPPLLQHIDAKNDAINLLHLLTTAVPYDFFCKWSLSWKSDSTTGDWQKGFRFIREKSNLNFKHSSAQAIEYPYVLRRFLDVILTVKRFRQKDIASLHVGFTWTVSSSILSPHSLPSSAPT